jgi:hypothetical protein
VCDRDCRGFGGLIIWRGGLLEIEVWDGLAMIAMIEMIEMIAVAVARF